MENENKKCKKRFRFKENPQFQTNCLYFGTGLLATGGLIFISRKFNILSRLLYRVDPKTTQNGGDIVAKVLKNHDVKSVFTLVGGHISSILTAAEREGIRVIDTRQEVTAVFAADAVARITGKIGVAAVTSGPGVTNTITAVKNAQMAESPLLLIGGAAATFLKGHGALQDIDQISLFKPLCKFTASVTNVRSIAPTLQKAIQISQSGTPGPVFVEFPIDVLTPYHLVKKELGLKPGKTLKQKLINMYFENHIHNVFAKNYEMPKSLPLVVSVPRASSSEVTKAVDMLKQSKRPLILAGSQATLPPVSPKEIQASLEKLGIPCYLGGMARGLLGMNNKLQMRQKRKDALKEADLVILAGSVADFRLSYGRVLSPNSKIISINRSKEQLYKNSGIFWTPSLAVQGDVGTFLQEVSKQYSPSNIDPNWISSLRVRDDKKENENREMAKTIPSQHLNPLKVLQDLDEILPENTILVADGGDFISTAAYTVRPRGPLTWLDPGAFGTLGVGAGFALGAKSVHPEAEVVIIYGDGSLGYSMIEYDTFVRHKLPVWSVVGNDACWMQIYREQVPLLKSEVACNLEYSEYHKSVEGLNAKGISVTKEDEARIKEAFQKARALYAQGHSVLVNVLIGRSTFREGSLSV